MNNFCTYSLLISLFTLAACQPDQETTKPVVQDITESVYASGILKSQNQYQAFATVSGIVNQVFVQDGERVEVGTPLLSIEDDAQRLRTENVRLTNEFNSLNVNRGKIDEAKSFLSLTESQLRNDSVNLTRQRNLWAQNIGTKQALEQKEIAYKSAEVNYNAAKEKLQELERQLKYQSRQAQNNLLISKNSSKDFVLKSQVKGKVYQLNIEKGEIVGPQAPVAIIGNDEKYILEMQIDEYDIVSIKTGMPVLVVLNSYRDSVFDAVVSKINPIMNVQSKTFTIEAEFLNPPEVLYPNISFEANVLISTKKDALLIPRNYLLNDSTVLTKNGEKLIVKTGLKDYQMVEIISGIAKTEELVLPEQ